MPFHPCSASPFAVFSLSSSARLSASESLLSSIEERIHWADERGQQKEQHRKDMEDRVEEIKANIRVRE